MGIRESNLYIDCLKMHLNIQDSLVHDLEECPKKNVKDVYILH